MPLLKTLKKQAKKAISPKEIGKRIELSMKERGRIRKQAAEAALKEREKQEIRIAVEKEKIKAKRKLEAFRKPRRFVVEGYGREAPTIKRKVRKMKITKKKGRKRKPRAIRLTRESQQVQRNDIDWLMKL